LAVVQFEIRRVAAESNLWETMGMITFKVGDVVIAQGHAGVFKIYKLSEDGNDASLEGFDVSKQRLLGNVVPHVPCSDLSPFKEDASQAAARIVEEATEGK
jgi:hypothetical protein